MIKIKFHLDNNNTTWSAEIHQLNSDILRRHILPKIQTNHHIVHFDYCELMSEGNILSSSGHRLGKFSVL
ncbi:hypothetical protein [Vibrio sp. CAU 1672]|uniref:hypothetical protein n=1 Tax=Vibrio sp. CAU 1672 TaxID=3032594 RepID=UPI0023DBD4F8|nr:hypothetical protein [Vibrio sp. CAU 1672]MDF2152957.1 hypothetical protein [Vibrio sp. CAU 1672]